MSGDGGQLVGRSVGGGRFELKSLLGAGGMASVYLAYDSVLDRRVAVKTLHSDLGREQSFRERFRREAQSVAKLTHTNIVSVFDSGEDRIDDIVVPYIVMEYVEGKPLRAVLDESIALHGAMPTDRALKTVQDVLSALEVSHEMGLVHRDIKPGNVMVTKRGQVKVMDFGIARAMQSGVTSMTQTGMVVGTPQYLSPEQALGRGVDARSDLYSVGILLFELLTGRLPFDADSPLAIAYAHVQEEPPVPSSINASLPPAVDALVARALRKNPSERFPTAEAMGRECARVASAAAHTDSAPSIVAGPSAGNSGAGVGQAVFPPVSDTGTPPPSGGHQAYGQPGWGGSWAPQGGSTPPPYPTSPMPQHAGYGTPAPYGHTPPPYTVSPTAAGAGGGGGRKSSMPVIVGSAAAAVIAVTAVVVALTTTGGDPGTDTGGPQAGPTVSVSPGTGSGYDPGSGSGSDPGSGSGSDETPGGSASGDDEVKPEDTSKKIDSTRCTDAGEHYSDKSKLNMPDLTYKNLTSVKECLRKAGWKLDEVEEVDEEAFWGKNMVLEQSPEPYEEFDPESDKVDLKVTTGKSG